ncbi:MAG: multicopper oxidase domain-containing protein [Gammaproteobacteria bacterium]
MKKINATALLLLLGLGASAYSLGARAQDREFDMTIEDTNATLVGNIKFHTFAYNGQVPGPLIHVKEGDKVTVHVTNLTTLTHTIHWHGLFQTNTWKNDGVPKVTQAAIEPGDTYTYKFVAAPAGTMWYHCHVNVNEHVVLRGMWGPLIIDPKEPTALEKKVTKDFVLMFNDWDSKWAQKPGYGGVPGDVYDYFTINGKAFPEDQPIRVKKGDFVRLRLIGAGDLVHSIHLHGHVFTVAFKDGHPLPSPYKADTILLGPGERYDILFEANNPGRWIIHDHVDSHTMNGDKSMGGMITIVEYEGVPRNDKWYVWKDKKYEPNFFYEESLKKGYGIFDNKLFKGVPIK